MKSTLRRFGGARRGAVSSEYVIIIGVVALLVMVVLTAFGMMVARRYKTATKALGGGGVYTERYEMDQVQPLNALAIPATNNPNPSTVPGVGPNLVAPASGRNIPAGNQAHYNGGNLGNPSGWDPAAILTDLTQIDQRADTVFDPQRCTRTSHLAAAVMCGPDAVRRVIDDMARQIQQGRQPFAQQPGGIAPIPPDRALRELSRIRDRLDSTSMDHNDSGMLLEIMAHYYQNQGAATGPVGLWPSSMNNLGQPNTRNVANGPLTQAQFNQTINGMQPGEAIRYVIEWPKTPPAVKDAVPNDHTILMGRDRDGRLYVFDPAPKGPGQSQIVYADRNPNEFNWYLQAGNTMGSNGSYYLAGSDPAGANVMRFCGGR
ncbi:MAG: hypothetical protein HZA54_06590 [Planctomycetes bacterium]|nr:hypothetical protein [Planctomycetota bacterium]